MDAQNNEMISLKKIIVSYLLHWKLFVCVGLFSFIPAILYLVFYPKTYEIVSRIQIQDDQDSGSGGFGLGEAAGMMKSFGLGGGSPGAINVDDELVILSSSELVSQMVKTLGLNVVYYKPYAYKYKLYDDSPLVITVDSMMAENLEEAINLTVSVSQQGQVKVESEVNKQKKIVEYTSLPATIQLQEGAFILDYRKPREKGESLKMDIQILPARWVAEDLTDVITIDEYSKNANVIELIYQDYEKKRGKDMLNVLVEKYNQRADKIRKQEMGKTTLFLDERIVVVTKDLSDVERRIEEYKIQNQMTDVEYDIQFYVEQMKDIQTKMIELEAQLHVINLMEDYIKNPENKYNLVPSLLSAQEGEKGSPITTYNETLLERARVIENSSINNPLVGTLTKQVDELRGSVFLSINNALKSLNMAKADLQTKEKVIMDKMGNVPTQEREYIDFKRQQEIFQGVYLILLQKREDAALSGGQDRLKARVIDAAFVKQRPVGPRKLFAAIGMIIFTLLVPVGYLFFKQQWIVLKEEYKKTK